MSHVVTQIREAFLARLGTIGAFGSRVYTGKTSPHTRTPDVTVATEHDEPWDGGDHDIKGPARFRELIVVIEVRTKATGDIAEVLDDYRALIETAVMANPRFNGQGELGTPLHDLEPGAVDVRLEGEAEKPVGLLAMTYRVVYRYDPKTPALFA